MSCVRRGGRRIGLLQGGSPHGNQIQTADGHCGGLRVSGEVVVVREESGRFGRGVRQGGWSVGWSVLACPRRPWQFLLCDDQVASYICSLLIMCLCGLEEMT